MGGSKKKKIMKSRKKKEEDLENVNDDELWPIVEDQLPCKVCRCYLRDEKLLEVHMLVWHQKNQDDFQCNLCGKILTSVDGLKKHVQFTCLKDRPVSCPICHNLSSPISLRIHVQSVHNKEKPHLCAECGRGFCTPTSLKTHREGVHEKLRNHVCKDCGKTFTTQGSLYVHKQRYHERWVISFHALISMAFFWKHTQAKYASMRPAILWQRWTSTCQQRL